MIDTSKLSGVEKTLLIPLIIKAKEYNHSSPIIHDKRAKEIVENLEINQGDYKINRFSSVASLFRARKFDSYVTEYLEINPEGTIIEIGPGLDTRFYRTDNGHARWVNIDLPNVIELRNKIFEKNDRVTNIDIPIEEIYWEKICTPKNHPLIIAEGVFVYIEKAIVLELLKKLSGIYPGSFICFDVIREFVQRRQSFQALKRSEVVMKWGINDINSIINSDNGCILIEQWRYYDKFEIRNGVANFLRFFPGLNNMFKVIKARFL